jgi:hypothetical protein
VILPDDTVVLADPYIVRSGPDDAATLAPKLVAEIRRLGRMLVRFGAKEGGCLSSSPRELEYLQDTGLCDGIVVARMAESDFVNTYVLDPLVEYHFVREIPSSCPTSPSSVTPPPGSQVEPVACTVGKLTWIVADLFKQMNVREQAKLIAHERMRAIPQANPIEFIADITTGVGLALDLYNQALNGKRPTLNDGQVGTLMLLLRRIQQVGMADDDASGPQPFVADDWHVSAAGGGLVRKDAKLDPAAFISAGSLLGPKSNVGPQAVLLNASCFNVECDIAGGAQVEQSLFAGAQTVQNSLASFKVLLAAGANVISSRVVQDPSANNAYDLAGRTVSAEAEVELDENASVSGTDILGLYQVHLGAGAKMVDDIIYMGSYAPGTIAPPVIELGEGSVWKRLPFANSLFVGQGASPAPQGTTVNLSEALTKLSVPENVQLDFGNRLLCPGDPKELPEGDFTIATIQDLRIIACQ